MVLKYKHILFIATFFVLFLTGCGEEESFGNAETEHADTATDYHSNAHGLITPETLERWVVDWSSNRPENISGDLVILQVGLSDAADTTVASSDGVRVYDVSEDISVLNEPRNNGIFAAGQAPARGVRIDAFFRKYDIDPQADLLTFVAGELSVDTFSQLSMGWLALRYWGVSDRLLAILNGDVGDLSPDVRAAEPTEALYEGTDRVLVLPSTEFSITLDVEDVRTWVQDRPEDVTLWDTRTLEEFEGRTISASPRSTSCMASEPLCTAVHSGRIAGAQHLPSADFFGADARIRAPGELRELLSDKGIDRRSTHFLYDGDGARSAIVAFVLLAVTRHPARWYPNSFVEWSALNASHPEPTLRGVDEDNPWRTDTLALSEALDVWAERREGVQPIVINARADTADRVLSDDQRYLSNPPALPVVNLDSPDCF